MFFYLDFSAVVQALPYSPVENFLFGDHSLFSFRGFFVVSEKLGWTFRISRNWEISLIFENRENLDFLATGTQYEKSFFFKKWSYYISFYLKFDIDSDLQKHHSLKINRSKIIDQ